MALTDTEIRRSKTTGRPYKLADERGLHLLVTPAGGKLWRWKYRFDGSEKLMALGQYPDVPLAVARERRDAARKKLASGVDPMVERMAEKTAVSEGICPPSQACGTPIYGRHGPSRSWESPQRYPARNAGPSRRSRRMSILKRLERPARPIRPSRSIAASGPSPPPTISTAAARLPTPR